MESIIKLFRKFPESRPYALIFLALGTLVVFFSLPLLIMLFYSFLQRDTYGGIQAIDNVRQYITSFQWVSNYVRSFQPIYLEIYWRSLLMAMITTVFCLLIGYPMAYYISLKVKPTFKN